MALAAHDITVGGHAVRWYDAADEQGLAPADVRLTVLWHHGTPNIGEPPAPLFEASAARGIRWIGFDRGGYGGSERTPGRSIADAARVALAVADAAGAERFAVMGHSGGGPHALATAALAPERVIAAVSGAGLAPRGAEGLDWFADMYAGGLEELEASVRGAADLQAVLEAGEFDPAMFTASDFRELEGRWAWFNRIAGAGMDQGLGGMIDDDLAYVAPWGADPGAITVPTLVVHGDDDRIVPVAHARWLAAAIPGAELLVREDAGHIAALGDGLGILDWLAARA